MFFNSLKLALDFLRSSYVEIGAIFLIRIIGSAILMKIPFGGILSTILSIVLYITLIDMFLKYKRKDVDLEPLIT